MTARKGQKYYVVWAGRQTGIFTSWDECNRQVKNYPKARYKSYPSREKAEAALSKGPRGAAPAKKAEISSSAGSAYAGSTTHQEKAPKKYTYTPPDKTYDTEIYCDGACEPNPGDAGSGIVIYRQGQLAELWYGLHDPKGTNNTAELNAFHQALHVARIEIDQGASVRIHCDSTYTINAITKWANGWKKRGWKKSDGLPIKNPEFIQPIHALYESLKSTVNIAHVKGHDGIEGNELADRMAMYGADLQEREFALYRGSYTVEDILKLKRG